MQAFELYFNPKKRDDLFVTSFIYTPADMFEKRLGNLYVVGELTQAMPQNTHFLANLSSVIKKEYYSSGLKKSCEASLEEALKKGNEFLDQESKKGNVGWLGNLNFSIISFKEPALIFAKTGDLKIFLARNNELTDLSQNLETKLPHPDPLKVFGSMAQGKLSDNDKIIVLNKRILMALGKKQKFLGELAKSSNEKELKQVLRLHQNNLTNISGICLVLMVSGKDSLKQTVTVQNELPDFSLSENLFKPFVRFFTFPKIKMPKIEFPKIALPTLPQLPRINFRTVQKKLILVLGLVLVLVSFYYLFQGERTQELKDAQIKLNDAQAKAMLAESLLILKKDVQARALFEEALRIISPLTKRGAPLREEALPLQDKIKGYLK